MTADELPRQVASHPDTIVVDARSALEFRRGHVPGAVTCRSGPRRLDPCRQPTLRRPSSCIVATAPARGLPERCFGGAVSTTSACSTATWPGGGAPATPSRRDVDCRGRQDRVDDDRDDAWSLRSSLSARWSSPERRLSRRSLERPRRRCRSLCCRPCSPTSRGSVSGALPPWSKSTGAAGCSTPAQGRRRC